MALVALLVPAVAQGDEARVIGRSVHDRPIVLFRSGPANAPLKVLVVGAIHGDETAGMRITRQLIAAPPLARVELLVVPTINPDGVAAHTRSNARSVDLNRNFPFRWRPLSGGEYSGPGPLSEPESKAAYRLILEERPDITIWFHQPFGLIDRPNGNPSTAHRFAKLIGLPLIRLQGPYPGSISRWQNHAFRTRAAFVAELPSLVNRALVRRGTAAIRTLATEPSGQRSMAVNPAADSPQAQPHIPWFFSDAIGAKGTTTLRGLDPMQGRREPE
ncbi:MAG TPA: M14 family zinc carboxypeptidase [Solirubrobacterales bacterium]|nr:M14 family zinc carboxypeptidase [Solirubrobacterales bacterium]